MKKINIYSMLFSVILPFSVYAEGTLELTVAPEDVDIYINGNLKAINTPIKIKLSDGRYAVELRKAGKQSHKMDILITDGVTISKNIMLLEETQTVLPIESKKSIQSVQKEKSVFFQQDKITENVQPIVSQQVSTEVPVLKQARVETNTVTDVGAKDVENTSTVKPIQKSSFQESFECEQVRSDVQLKKYKTNVELDEKLAKLAICDKALESASSATITEKLFPTKVYRVMKEHQGPVNAVAFSPDGLYVASGSSDKTVKLWSTEKAESIRTFSDHQERVWSVAFSPDGKYLASGTYKTIKIWNAKTGELLQSLQAHDHWVGSLAFSPGGNYLISGSYDKTVKIWDIKTGKLVRIFKGHNNFVSSVAFSPDGQTIASGSHDKTIQLWRLESEELLRTIQTEVVNALAFSSDGQRLASGSDSGAIHVWDVNTGQLLTTLQEHSEKVISLSFSTQSHLLASSSNDGTIKLWNIDTGEVLQTLQEFALSVVLSPDGRRLVSGSYDYTVKLWQ